MEGNGQHEAEHNVGQKRNRDQRVAWKTGTRYLFWQPWLPPKKATLVRGASVLEAPTRPVFTSSY